MLATGVFWTDSGQTKLPFIGTDKYVTFLCASACPSNHSDVLSRVSAYLQNALKDVISIHSFDSGQGVPTPQGI